MYDLIVGNGRVLDPATGLDGASDIGISGGRIAAVEERLDPGDGASFLDAAGLTVTPGLIDLHVHVYEGVTHYGVFPDEDVLASGVTTALDAGSAGAATFAGLRRYLIDVSDLRLFALLNISAMGMLDEAVGELEDIRWADPARAIAVCEQNRDVILGIKIRLTRNLAGENARPALLNAREAADAVGLPVMVHPQAAAISLEEILGELKAGDLVTHCFHGLDGGVLDGNGDVHRCVREAVDRGVIFDVGHGKGSFDFNVAERALAQGLIPDTISSDLHVHNINGPVFDLATTLSKFLLLGYEPAEALRRCTVTPAAVLGMEEEIGTLAVDAHADLTLFEIAEGGHGFEDSGGQQRTGDLRFVPRQVVKAGHAIPAVARGYAAG